MLVRSHVPAITAGAIDETVCVMRVGRFGGFGPAASAGGILAVRQLSFANIAQGHAGRIKPPGKQ